MKGIGLTPKCCAIDMAMGNANAAAALLVINSVAIAVYEALRQSDYAGLLEEGELHNHKWSEVE